MGNRLNLQDELAGLHDNLTSDCRLIYISQKQVWAVNSLLSAGLESKSDEVRHEVLDMLVGRAMKVIANVPKVTSAKNLTSPVASFLINQLKEPNSNPWRLSDYGERLLRLCETEVETQIATREESLLPG